MDVCAAPLPPPNDPDAKAAEVAAVYDPLLERLARMAVRFADKLETTEEIPLPEKVKTLAGITTVVRRNALMARHLHEPLPTAPLPSRSPGQPRRRPYPRTQDGQIDYNKLTDEELEGFIALEQADIERREREEAEQRERLEALERLEPRERLERLDPLDPLPDLASPEPADGTRRDPAQSDPAPPASRASPSASPHPNTRPSVSFYRPPASHPASDNRPPIPDTS